MTPVPYHRLDVQQTTNDAVNLRTMCDRHGIDSPGGHSTNILTLAYPHYRHPQMEVTT